MTQFVDDSRMKAFKHRLVTFKEDWPFNEDCSCTPEKMAEAGFYLVGSQSEPDLVRCYYCRRELDGWEPQDIPWDEHKRRDCPYITLGKLTPRFDCRGCVSAGRRTQMHHCERGWQN